MEISEKKRINAILDRLSKSKFRSSFKLKDVDKKYIDKKGLDQIRLHAYDFIEKRLTSDIIPNDGKQTPMKGHPVFIGQHATATCCRRCLFKWHRIKPNIVLTKEQKDYIVDVIMKWINNQI